ncbi:MAG: hypothetical protein HY303_04835 [Candidatus Wallbacteria bacterium]|nr:hypothetical protein [Candidatus Wallbacteria bacterium]
MNCTTARDEFSELLAEQPDARPAGSLAAHLDGCTACAAELDHLRSALAGIGALAVCAAPAGFTDLVMGKLGAGPSLLERLRHSWKGAAVAAAVAGVLAIGSWAPRGDKPLPAMQPSPPAAARSVETPAGRAATAPTSAPATLASSSVSDASSHASPTARRHAPPPAGPRTEAVEGNRDGRPVESPADAGNLDRPLDGPRP